MVPQTAETELAALAAETGLAIKVCHHHPPPPGTSKWNRIEHKLFSFISMNWRGRPLTSHEVIINTIGATTTRAGLKVEARLDEGTYLKGVKITDPPIVATGWSHAHGGKPLNLVPCRWRMTCRGDLPATAPPGGRSVDAPPAPRHVMHAIGRLVVRRIVC